jgi:hypothetical protein
MNVSQRRMGASDGNTARAGMADVGILKSPPATLLPCPHWHYSSSIEEIMVTLPSLCLRLLKGRPRACFSSACVHAYSTRELRTHHALKTTIN